jgi:hypothetical protein
MNQQPSNFNTKFEKTMSPEQFAEVIEAILNGKYSWACVLILRFAGYNPLHYIPYRTYNRIIKENHQIKDLNRYKTSNTTLSSGCHHSSDISSQKYLDKIKDLNYLEPLEKQPIQIKGGISHQNRISDGDTEGHSQFKDQFRQLKDRVFSLIKL